MSTWMNVPNWPDYRVSDAGEVYYVRREKILKLSRGNCVTLYKNGSKRCVNPGNLVLESFIGQCPEGMECCHNDDNRRNNCLSNVRWDTRRANMADRKRNGRTPRTGHLYGENANRAIMTQAQVSEAMELRETAPDLWPYSRLGERYGVSRSTVLKAVNGKNWKHMRKAAAG